jgi:hypothetical protein
MQIGRTLGSVRADRVREERATGVWSLDSAHSGERKFIYYVHSLIDNKERLTTSSQSDDD